MNYEKKNFEYLSGLKGLSEELMKNHYSLYEGYVNNSNKFFEIIEKLAKEDKLAEPEYTELKRRFGWEWNGMRLHEYYFGNLSSEPQKADESLAPVMQIKKDFGSFSDWERDFRGMGAMRGIGWVILYFDLGTQKLFNAWINEHDVGHLAGAQPILVMDVFEHAYMLDYGIKKADYISAFMNTVDWKVIVGRYDWATRIQEVKPIGIDHIGCRC
jgi:superoxide dismutase, Fe-Mn family